MSVILSHGTEDSLIVRCTFDEGLGSVIYIFEDLEHFKSNEINCVLKAEVFIQDKKGVSMSSRLNILSLSSREAFTRSLSKMTDVKVPLEKTLNQAIEEVKRTVEDQDHSQWFEDIPQVASTMLFKPFIVDGSPSILFGKGGGAKTYISLRLALSLATMKPFMGFLPARKTKTLFIDYEDTGGTFTNRLHSLIAADPALGTSDVSSSIRYFPAQGIPLTDLVKQLKKLIQRESFGFIIVDSAVAACGNEAEKAETAARYFNALKSLGVASLTIAHETKSEDHKYPFGSVFWYNFPRSIWNAQAVRDDDEVEVEASGEGFVRSIETGLFHRKANNGPLCPSIPLKVKFFEDREENVYKVEIGHGEAGAWEAEKSPQSRILKLLAISPHTRTEFMDELPDMNKNTLDNSLTRLKAKGIIQLAGTKGSPYLLAKNRPKVSAEMTNLHTNLQGGAF